MTIEKEIEALQNGMQTFEFPKKYFVQKTDGRIGKKYAIASNTENGGINTHSKYMTYNEFNCYLIGYYDCKRHKF